MEVFDNLLQHFRTLLDKTECVYLNEISAILFWKGIKKAHEHLPFFPEVSDKLFFKMFTQLGSILHELPIPDYSLEENACLASHFKKVIT